MAWVTDCCVVCRVGVQVWGTVGQGNGLEQGTTSGCQPPAIHLHVAETLGYLPRTLTSAQP